ncbi:MAG: hypothetical protein IJH83_06145, partial [Coriobacteriales bacterium]|nr:hypothetical protein [Coriobacteriales bacterium]
MIQVDVQRNPGTALSPGDRQSPFIVRNWFTVGVIGLGFAIAASSFHRYTAVRNVTDDSAAGMIASFAAILLGCLALFFISRKDMRLYSRPAFLVCMLVVCTVRALLLVSPLGGIISTDVLAPVVEVLRVAEIGLLLAYAEFFMRLGAGNHIKAFGLALMITGTVEFASAFITVVAAQVLLVLVAALAPTLLWVAARSQMRLSPDIDETREATVVHNVIDVSKAPSLLWALWIMLFLVVALFGNIHTSWIPEQDAAITSQLIQITAGSTTILVGNIIFLARHVLEDPLTTDFCKNLVLPLTV